MRQSVSDRIRPTGSTVRNLLLAADAVSMIFAALEPGRRDVGGSLLLLALDEVNVGESGIALADLTRHVAGKKTTVRSQLLALTRQGLARQAGTNYLLTPAGRSAARELAQRVCTIDRLLSEVLTAKFEQELGRASARLRHAAANGAFSDGLAGMAWVAYRRSKRVEAVR